MNEKWFRDRRAYGTAGVETACGFLGNNLDIAAQAPEIARAETGNVLSAPSDRTRADRRSSQQCATQRRFAAAAFTDETDDLSRMDVKVDAP
jgi:hypothetical protein